MCNKNCIISSNAISWIESVLCKRFGIKLSVYLNKKTYDISVENSNQIVSVKRQDDFYKFGLTSIEFCDWDAKPEGWSQLIAKKIPAPGLDNNNDKIVVKANNGYLINYDIIGLMYWMFNRLEEVGRKDLDQYERFSSASSHAFKYGYLERPIVDEWLDILKQVMKRIWPSLKFYNHQFQIKVSHDVDVPSRYIFRNTFGLLRSMVGDVLKRGDYSNAFLAPWVRLKSHAELPKNDPLNTFDWIMDQSEKHNLKSAFYFICGKTHSHRDADYEIEHPAIRSLMRTIHKRGHEIGLHPSYNTYLNPDTVVKEARKLRKICDEEAIKQQEWGGRMHYLRWKHPTTLHGWEAVGMNYESTLSYADHAGFRCGTCFEYPAFDPVTDKQLNLRIRPLIAMDVTVSGYMGLSFTSAAYDKFTELKNACRAVDGTFTLLWHNNQLETKQQKELYNSLLK